MKNKRYILLIFSLLILSVGFLSAGRQSAKKSDEAAMRKARSFYLEGGRLQTEDKVGDAYEMFKHALRIRPDYPEAQMQVAQIRLVMRNDSLQSDRELARTVEMMRRYVDTYPADYFENQYYAYVATELDSLGEARRMYERSDSIYPERTGALLKLADVCMRMRDKDATFRALDRYREREGRSDQLSHMYVIYSLSFSDTVAALDEAHQHVRLNPLSASANVMVAKLYQFMQRPDSVLPYLQRAEELDPEDGSVKYEIATFYRSRGDSLKYADKIYECLKSEDLATDQKIGLLSDYVKHAKTPADSVRLDNMFDVMLNLYPHEPDLRYLSSTFNLSRKDYTRAIEDIDFALDLKPEHEPYHLAKILLNIYIDDYAAGLKAFRRAEETSSTLSWGLLEMAGVCAVQLPDSTAAYDIFNRMLDLIDPNLDAEMTSIPLSMLHRFDSETAEEVSSVFCSLGDLEHNLGHAEKSYGKYRLALQVDPENSLALNNFAYFSALDDYELDKALEMSEKSLELKSDSPTYLDTFAYILFRLGRYDEALEYQQQALQLYDNEDDAGAEFYDHLGDIYFFLNRKDEALKNWQKALQLEPDSPVIKRKIDNKQYYEK